MQPVRPAPGLDRRNKQSGRRKIFLWLGCATALLAGAGLLCCGGLIFWESRNYRVNSDPVQIREALGRLSDLELPEGLAPFTTSTNSRTDLERVEFRGPGRHSYLILVTWQGQQLTHQSTLKDAADRGTVAGGGRPEQPSQSRTLTLAVRGQPAEFIVRQFATFETVSGYFQGKRYPVFLDAQFDRGEFPVGTAERLVRAVEAGGLP